MSADELARRVTLAAPHVVLTSLCLGLAAALVVPAPPTPWVAVPVAALALIAAGEERSRRFVWLALVLALVGWAWGSSRVARLDSSDLEHRIGESAPALVAVTGPPRRGTFALRMAAEVRRWGRELVREPVLLELPLGRAPPQGTLLEVVAEVQAPRRADEAGGFDERGWLRRQGVQVVLRAAHARVVGRRGGLVSIADRLHGWLGRSLGPGLGGERHAVLAGVVLGADEGLSEELRDRFRSSGLYHLLAVSGQNVVFIGLGVLGLAWLLGISRWVAELGVLFAIGAYVLAVGLQPSVVRAGVAGALASLAWLAARPRDRWYFLLAGAAVLLAWNPYNLLEPGFQLSFTAVAAIFLLVPRFEALLAGYPLPSKLAAPLAVSSACSLATAPVLLLQFGTVPTYSVLANAIAEPVVGPLLGLGLLTAVVDTVAPTAAVAMAWCNGWLACYLAGCARLVGGLPGAQVSSPRLLGLGGVAVLLLVVAVRLRPPRRARALALLVLAAVVTLAWRDLRPGPAAVPPPHGLRISFLDVGQGDGALLQVPDGAVLVDEGPPEAEVAHQLETLGVRSLSAVVLTHPQRDHIGGAEDVLDRLHVGFVLDPGLDSESGDERGALRAATQHHVPVVLARAGQSYQLGRLRIRVLWPRDAGTPGEDPNENAIVLLASYGKVDVLLTADAESDVTLPLRPPPVEILKVAHHGSADEGLPALLRLLHPRVAIVSVGAGNDYGHPTPSTMAALASSPGTTVYRTDQDGRIVVESDGVRLSVRSQR